MPIIFKDNRINAQQPLPKDGLSQARIQLTESHQQIGPKPWLQSLIKEERCHNSALVLCIFAGLHQRVTVMEGKANKLLTTGDNLLITQ